MRLMSMPGARSILATLMLCIAAICAGASASVGAVRWQTGDTLVYDVTIELQQHKVPKHGAATKETTQESATAGSETFVVNSVDSNGAAAATAYLDFQGSGGGRTGRMTQSIPATILPDGQVVTTAMQGAEASKAFALANEAIVELRARPLRIGQMWQAALALGGIPMTLTRAVAGQQQYLGYPTFAIATSGGATMQTATQNGRLSLTSSLYYDPRDRLFIGESVRSFSLILNKSGGHTESTATVNIALRSASHAPAVHASQPRGAYVRPATPPRSSSYPTTAPAYQPPVNAATSEPSANPIAASPLPTVTP